MVFTPTTKYELQKQNAWIAETINASTLLDPSNPENGDYGEMNNWDVSAITDKLNCFKTNQHLMKIFLDGMFQMLQI